jgi:hypothetical protein
LSVVILYQCQRLSLRVSFLYAFIPIVLLSKYQQQNWVSF